MAEALFSLKGPKSGKIFPRVPAHRVSSPETQDAVSALPTNRRDEPTFFLLCRSNPKPRFKVALHLELHGCGLAG